MDKLHSFELPLIEMIQSFRTPFWDRFFLILNFFDTPYFPFLFIPIIWMGYSWKWGARMFYILVLSGFVDSFLKILFMQPRPFHMGSSFFLLNLQDYGFPSGAAINAILYAGIMIYYWKRKVFAWILGINIIFWMSLSRIYLGVHFLSDIIGGWIVGVSLLLVFLFWFPKMERFIASKKLLFVLLFSQLFPLCMFLLLNNKKGDSMAVAAMFVGLGLILSKKWNLFLPVSKSFLEGFLRVLLTFVGLIPFAVFFLKFSDRYYVTLLQYAGGGLWLSLGASFVWKKMFMKSFSG